MSAGTAGRLRARSATTLAIAAAGVALWFVAGAGARRLRSGEETAGVIAGRRAKGEAVASVLGGFRGLASDFLWLRAIQMLDEGRYDELVLLYKLILDLQPRFTSVWRYSSWNFAYNLAFEANTPEERWHWIDQGLRLLVEDGVHRNRNAWEIPWEIGHTYFFRVSRKLYDPFYRHYQERIAPVPRWCRERFEFVDLGLRSDRGVRYRLYRGRFPAGRVVLGGAAAAGGYHTRAARMYVVIVKPADALVRAARIAGGRSFELGRAELRSGARLYADALARVGAQRLHRMPLAGELQEPTLPAELEGSALVPLPHGDRVLAGETYLTLELASPSEVWVGWPPDETRNFHIARRWLMLAERLCEGRMLMVSRLRVHALVEAGEWEKAYEEFAELMLTRPPGDKTIPGGFQHFLMLAVYERWMARDEKGAEKWHGRLRANFPSLRLPARGRDAPSETFPSIEDVARYVATMRGLPWRGEAGEEKSP